MEIAQEQRTLQVAQTQAEAVGLNIVASATADRGPRVFDRVYWQVALRDRVLYPHIAATDEI